MKTKAKPLEGSVRVNHQDEIVFTMGVDGAEYLAELITSDCAAHPAEQAWHDAAALMEAVDTVRRRYYEQCARHEYEQDARDNAVINAERDPVEPLDEAWR
jgi:hypothetical protein